MTRIKLLQNDIELEIDVVIENLEIRLKNALINKKYALGDVSKCIIEKEIEAYTSSLEMIKMLKLNVEECFLYD